MGQVEEIAMGKEERTADRGFGRREFLQLSGMMGIGLIASAVIPPSAEAVKFNRKLYKISETRLAMGTFVSMTLLHPSRDQAEKSMGDAFEEMNRLNSEMSRFDQRTAVAQLNHEGYLKDVPPDIKRVLKGASSYYRLSNGAFDVTVKPVVDLLKKRFAETNSPPREKEIQKALELVDGSSVRFDNGGIRFAKPEMGITLDGIAKGYIVDRAADVLSKYGIENYLINAGGDIRTMGRRQDGKPWTVAVQDPQKKQQYPDKIQMTKGAVATSGNYEVYFDREKMFHHIVNPMTGLSPEANVSVSVLAGTAMDADALSTSIFVMAPEKGIGFVNALSGCECLVISKRNGVLRSKGWRSA